MAPLGDDSLVIGYESLGQDGSYEGVYFQKFDGKGNRIGEEHRMNIETRDDQHRMTIFQIVTDQYVGVWESENKDGDKHGIVKRQLWLCADDYCVYCPNGFYECDQCMDEHILIEGVCVGKGHNCDQCWS